MVGVASKKLGIRKFNEKFKEIKALDSTVTLIASSLALTLKYEGKKSGIKISTLYNVSKNLPERVEIVPAKVNDRKCISEFINDKEVLYLFDRGYYNYSWYDKLTDEDYRFITRQVPDAIVEELRSNYVNNDEVFDCEITLGTEYSKHKTRNSYREILTFNEEGEEIRLITNVFNVPAEEILELYRLRWKIELFFKWIKQNLKIKKWIGYNENAVKIQIYTALISYIILALLKLDLNSKLSILQLTRIICLNLLEGISIFELLSG